MDGPAALFKPAEWPSSARFLVAANLAPLFMIFFAGWSMGEILFLYWLESVIVGLFNIFKMIFSAPHPLGPAHIHISPKLDLAAAIGAKLFMCGFFIVHFGTFMLVHGMFLGFMCGQFKLISADIGFRGFLLSVKWAVLALLVSHGYSFFANYLRGGEYRTASLRVLMQQPYPRIVVMHLTILAGFFLVMLVGRSAGFLFLFTLLKTAADLKAHLRERQKFRLAA